MSNTKELFLGITITISILACAATGLTVTRIQSLERDYEAKLDTSYAIVSKLQDDITSVTTEYDAVKTELQARETELTSVQKDLSSLAAELTKVRNNLSVTTAELIAIQDKYPLSDFASITKLDQWASAHTKIYDWNNSSAEFRRAQDIVTEGIIDGYYIWVDLDNVSYDAQSYCMAFVNDQAYWWYAHSNYYDGIHVAAGMTR